MKTIFRAIAAIVLSSGIALSCSYAGPEKYGKAIVNRQVTAVKDILAAPADYDGKTVTVEGRIANECPSGCWFYLKVTAGNAVIYVDIAPAGFAIPQKAGRSVLVEGNVVNRKSGPIILGQGVEIK